MPVTATAVIVDPLAKILPDEAPLRASGAPRGVRGEVVHVQVAYRAETYDEYDREECAVRVDTRLTVANVQLVRLVPCELPAYPRNDLGYLITAPGMLPDRLERASQAHGDEGALARFMPDHWQSVFIELAIDDELGGDIPFEVAFIRRDGTEHARVTGTVRVEPDVDLRDTAPFPRTEWFHADSLSAAYGVPMWSEEHWRAIENHVASMVDHGIDTLLTPLLTPPLDTAVGGHRAVAQLVGARIDDGGWRFEFSRLDRWLDMASRTGIRLLEFAPLYTQWGAAHAPQVIASTDGAPAARVFGWETDASAADYEQFLDALLRALVDHLAGGAWAGRFFFHISDEPSVEHEARYRRARDVIRQAVGDVVIRDATVHPEHFRTGLIESPVAGLEVARQFVDAGATDVWAYTSCAHHVDLPNVFIALTGARCRMIGVALFLTGARGYLRWGYNFWFSQYSRRFIDPRRETSAGQAFPSGDAFLVYPGDDLRPEESLRLKYLRQAMDDVRLLYRASELIGRPAALELVNTAGGGPITLTHYPDDPAFFARLRDSLIRVLAGDLAGGIVEREVVRS